ncbi:TAP42-like protein [Naematelia encephala]|uniref:TAP42-like protein n=1 Tax=Naematelia encephala TaxID=71784 RepID=A0A1Y2AWI1_9TREE|nr:TAP42-like protein [Naematelia encephala]
MSSTDLPIPQFYAQTLQSLVPIFDDTLSTSDSSAQTLLASALDNLHLIARMLTSLGVFSDNETADELGDKELVFMSLGWVIAECESRGGLGGPERRKAALERSQHAMNGFLSLLASYKVLSPEEYAESSASADSGVIAKDPAKRREAKIRQYRREKELRQQISTMANDHPDSSSTPLIFILSLLPSTSASRPAVISTSTASTSVNPDSHPDIRETSLLLLRLLHTLALASLSSTAMELDILASAPASISELPPPPEDLRSVKRGDEDNTWRLDRTPGQYKPRELISGGGRVLRPFTILPSTSSLSDRARLQGEVFRSSHRLPTMTIDEYLEEERRRGNIITGGGQASYDAPTESELLELAAEEDGNAGAEEAEEKKRIKEENWARYTDDNRKGAGNTMNRG